MQKKDYAIHNTTQYAQHCHPERPRFARGEGSAFRAGAAPFAGFKGCGFRVNFHRGTPSMQPFKSPNPLEAMTNEF
jgi:hypothetical protein